MLNMKCHRIKNKYCTKKGLQYNCCNLVDLVGLNIQEGCPKLCKCHKPNYQNLPKSTKSVDVHSSSVTSEAKKSKEQEEENEKNVSKIKTLPTSPSSFEKGLREIWKSFWQPKMFSYQNFKKNLLKIVERDYVKKDKSDTCQCCSALEIEKQWCNDYHIEKQKVKTVLDKVAQCSSIEQVKKELGLK